MSDLAKIADDWGKLVQQTGKGDPVDGVFVLQTAKSVVTRDHNGQLVSPGDKAWNSDQAVLERRSKRG